MDVKKIALYIFIFIFIIYFIYFIFLRPSSSSTNKNGKGNNCSHCDLDKNTCNPRIGQCIPKVTCNGKEKPDNACNYTCFKDNKWVCDTYPCVNSYFPDYIDCNIDQLKCDNSYLYCQGVTGCNGGDRYYYGANNTSCICPTGFKGSNSNCEFSDEKTCNKVGTVVDDHGNCSCNQPYYGKNCESKCGPTGMVYDSVNRICICGPTYESIGDTCTLRKCNAHGTLNGNVCACTGGWTGTNCETSICNANQDYDEKTKSCICKTDKTDNTPYTRYHKPECTLYHCNLESEYKDDGTCDCLKDKGSCGQFCQYTRAKNCNNNGDTRCNDAGTFTSCVCDNGWTGPNCQCEISKKPGTDNDQCKGISTICGPTGWQPYYSKCQDLFTHSYQNENEWSKSCIDKLFPTKFYKQTYKDGSTSTIGSLKCEDSTANKGDQSYICTDTICLHGQGCSSNPGVCADGKKVNICDLSTNYDWKCLDQLSGDCDSASIGNICKSGNPAECFHCGTLYTTEFVCNLDGGTPSIDCIKGLGIEKITPTNYLNGIYIDKSSSGLPIYPTTSKEACSNLFLNKSNTNPYSIQTYTNPTILSNPVASYDSDNKYLIDLTSGNNLYFYPNLKNGSNAKCILDQTDLMTYLHAPAGSTLCSSQGTFIQNTTTKGEFILNPDDNSPGHCQCNPGYAGNNCQYSDSRDCNGKATVDDNGKCSTCAKGFAGEHCQFTRNENCSTHGDPVSTDGTTLSPCTCDTGYMGNTCQFSNDSCELKFPDNSTTPVNEAVLNGKAKVDNNKLICDYSDTCGVPKDANRDNCRLLVGIWGVKGGSPYSFYYLDRLFYNSNYIKERENDNGHLDDRVFSFKNYNSFNGVVFTTKRKGVDIWSGDNYKIRSVRLIKNDDKETIIPVPDTISPNIHPGDEARAFCYYIPINEIADDDNYYFQIESREVGTSKAIIYVYLTMETSLGDWTG